MALTVSIMFAGPITRCQADSVDNRIRELSLKFDNDRFTVDDLTSLGGTELRTEQNFLLERCDPEMPTIDPGSFETQALRQHFGFLPKSQVAIHAIENNLQSWEVLCRLSQSLAQLLDGIINLNGRLACNGGTTGLLEIPYDGSPDSPCYHCCTAGYMQNILETGQYAHGLVSHDTGGSSILSGLAQLSRVLRDLPPPIDE